MQRHQPLPTDIANAAALNLPSLWRGQLFGAIAALAATAIALPLELLLHNANLALFYVLAVIVTGLRCGTRAAVTASVVAFLCFNFFLTEPRYSFHVVRRDELATLIFLALIAAICGPVASRIRRQFWLLQEANRYSEGMRMLGQELSVADKVPAAWLAVAKVLLSSLQRQSYVVSKSAEGNFEMYPKPPAAIPLDQLKSLEAAANTSQHPIAVASSAWTVFPMRTQRQCIAFALIRREQNEEPMKPHDRMLIDAVLQQGVDTWNRIRLVGELESARITTRIEQLRSALLSSVSHDLKSPLASMMGAAESLRLLDNQLDDQDRGELTDTIFQECHRLDSYIQNLLDMTRLGYGTLKIERDWVSVDDIVASALARLKRYYPNAQTEYHCLQSTPLIYAHAALIEQALFNILENAAKFSPAGDSIYVNVFPRGDFCVVEVSDNGPGIAAPLRELIFDMFYVAAEGDQKKHGTGMGLAICRSMLAAHGGSVRAEANHRRGTKMVVELPLNSAFSHKQLDEEAEATP